MTAQCPVDVQSVNAETKEQFQALERNSAFSMCGVCMEVGKASCNENSQLLGVDRQLLFIPQFLLLTHNGPGLQEVVLYTVVCV